MNGPDDPPEYEDGLLPTPEPAPEPELELPDPEAGTLEIPASVWCLRCEDRLARKGSRFCAECWTNLQRERRRRERR